MLESIVLLLEPGAVVALPRDAMTAVQLKNPLCGVIQEVTIVGHAHNSSGELGQKLLKPLNALSIQVVGGLV